MVDRVLPELTRWSARAISSGLRTRLTVGPYERELERYGGPESTRICEELACADSVAVRGLLPLLAVPAPSAPDLLELGLVGIADLLYCLAGEDAGEQARWAKRLAAGTGEAGVVFRARKRRLRALLDALGDGSWDAAGEPWGRIGVAVDEILTARRKAVVTLAGALRACAADGAGTRTAEELAGSVVHLHANRLGLDRAQERCVLGILDRTLRSLAAFSERACPGDRRASTWSADRNGSETAVAGSMGGPP